MKSTRFLIVSFALVLLTGCGIVGTPEAKFDHYLNELDLAAKEYAQLSVRTDVTPKQLEDAEIKAASALVELMQLNFDDKLNAEDAACFDNLMNYANDYFSMQSAIQQCKAAKNL